jgi:hypothetical protein
MYKRTILLTTALLLSSIAGQVMAQQDPNLFGWWKLDEGQGTTVADSSGKGNHGTIVNPGAGLGPGGSVWLDDSERGTIISFNGTAGGAYVRAGKIPQMTLTNDFTWAFWAKQDAGNLDNDIIFGNRMNENAVDFSPRQFIKFTPTKLEWHQNANGNDNLDYADIPNGEWLHHAAVKTGSRLTYYRNGVMANSGTITQALNFPMPLFFGGDNENLSGENWQGMMSDARVYTRALTAAEIKAIGAQPKARKPNPANGALSVAMPLLQWTAGEGALFHSVYLSTSPTLTDADLKSSRSPMAMYYHIAGFTAGATYYWRVDEIEKDGVTTHTGDVWTFTMQDLAAYHPAPANKATDASPAPTLTWLPGQGAVKHTVYFSDSLDAVTQGAAAANKGTLALADATFAPGALESLKTYYWRVDETLASGTKTGPVWSFTTFLSVDDFESYTDDLAAKTTIFDTWIDGYANGLSGSTVGNDPAPFAERGIVHGGLQSMPMDYNNVKTPFYSEAEREFAPTGDWTASGADTLVLYVRGTPGAKPAPLYVAVEDSAKKSGTVTHPDSTIVAASKWTEWKIPLSSFTGVNLAKVKKLYIGVGDKKAPAAGGAGRIYLDDIRVTKP